jgi:hypothetical protein
MGDEAVVELSGQHSPTAPTFHGAVPLAAGLRVARAVRDLLEDRPAMMGAEHEP